MYIIYDQFVDVNEWCANWKNVADLWDYWHWPFDIDDDMYDYETDKHADEDDNDDDDDIGDPGSLRQCNSDEV